MARTRLHHGQGVGMNVNPVESWYPSAEALPKYLIKVFSDVAMTSVFSDVAGGQGTWVDVKDYLRKRGPLRYIRLQIEAKRGGVTLEDFSIDNKLNVTVTSTFGPNPVESWYPSVEALPKHLYEKLAVLLLCDPENPPTPDIEGVGRRISFNTFWIYT